MPDTERAICPGEFARRYGIGPHKTLALIAAGILKAIDCRAPGSSRPLWRITPQAIEEFERNRAATPPAPKTQRRKAKTQDYTHYF